MPSTRRPVKNKKNSSAISKSFLFWLAFFIVVALLFIINIPKISKTWESVFGKSETALGGSSGQDSAPPQTESTNIDIAQGTPSVRIAELDTGITVTGTEPDSLVTPAPELSETNSAIPAQAVKLPDAQEQAGTTQAPPPAVSAKTAPAQENTQNYRERTIYLVKIDNSTGLVFLSSVQRKVSVNDSPLVSTLNILLEGPTAAEKRQGLISLIPAGTKILGATVEKNTAIINFSENFMFNTFGAEGYIAQLKQIIWTATEFPNITEVDLRIEGKKIEYLGETIKLDRPKSRDSF